MTRRNKGLIINGSHEKFFTEFFNIYKNVYETKNFTYFPPFVNPSVSSRCRFEIRGGRVRRLELEERVGFTLMFLFLSVIAFCVRSAQKRYFIWSIFWNFVHLSNRYPKAKKSEFPQVLKVYSHHWNGYRTYVQKNSQFE